MADNDQTGMGRVKNAANSPWVILAARALTIIVSGVGVPVVLFLFYQSFYFFKQQSVALEHVAQSVALIQSEQQKATSKIDKVSDDVSDMQSAQIESKFSIAEIRRVQAEIKDRVGRVERVFFPPPHGGK